jgi:hypothetical protein
VFFPQINIHIAEVRCSAVSIGLSILMHCHFKQAQPLHIIDSTTLLTARVRFLADIVRQNEWRVVPRFNSTDNTRRFNIRFRF